MLKKFQKMAQKSAMDASRRDFLRGLTKGAAGAAIAAGTVLASASFAFAAKGGNGGGKGGDGSSKKARRDCCLKITGSSKSMCEPPAEGCEFMGCGLSDTLEPACIWNCGGPWGYSYCS